MKLYPNERVALIIDGTKLHATAKALAFDIDYKRLLHYFRSKTRLVRAFYYTVLAEETEYSSIRPLIDWLDYNGFQVVTKPAKEFTDSSGRRTFKGNMDVEIAVDSMRMANTLDHFVFFSGNGDLRSLVSALQDLGKRVTVVSSLDTNPPMIADELRRQADHFIDLADFSPNINRVYSDVPPRQNGKAQVKAVARDFEHIDEDEN
jgi:uncharacterized LabA/DUF88 family protein